MKVIYLFLAILWSIGNLAAQPNSANRNIVIPTTASLGVSWDPDVSKYSGAANLNVPIYTIKDYQYNFPINLVYGYSGLRYNDYASVVGLHWSLSVPIITRNVVNKDDFNPEKGYIFVKPEDRNEDKNDMPDIFTLHCPEGTVKFFGPVLDSRSSQARTEIQLEILYDNSGLFTISYNKTTKVIIVSSIKGIVYTFDVFANTKCQIKTQPTSDNPDEYYISNWYPSKITLANKKVITFQYTTSAYKLKSYAAQMSVVAIYNPNGNPNISGSAAESYMFTDEVLLSKINWDHGSILFNYLDRDDIPVEGTAKAKRLSTIEVSNKKNEVVNTTKLVQEYFTNENVSSKRLKLAKLQEFGNSLTNKPDEYLFEYDSQPLPNYGVLQRYFGYDSVRTTSAALLSVRFPTGLTTKYLYERNDYNPTASNSSTPNNKHLGARVSSISSYNRNGLLISNKKYSYTYEDGRSSGLVHCKENNHARSQGLYYFTTSNNWFPPVYQSELIGYSSVLEQETLPEDQVQVNGGRRTNFYNQPTSYNSIILGATPTYDFKNGQVNSEILYKGANSSSFTQVQTTTYSDVVLSTETYETLGFTKYPSFVSPSQFTNIIKSQRARLLTITTKTAAMGDNQQYAIESQTFSYPSTSDKTYTDFLPVKKTYWLADVFQKSISYKYPYNLSTGRGRFRKDHAIDFIGDKTTVVEELQQDKDGKIVAGTINDFTYDFIATPSATYKLDLVASLPDTTVTSTMNGTEGVLVLHPNYRKTVNYVHDSNGNLLEISDNTNSKLAYIWGYNNLYPIAEIKNASYADVVAVLGQPLLTSLNLVNVSESSITSAMATLRNDSRMKSALITGNVYRPLTGMTRKINPRGISEFYEKDGFHRLIAVRDDEGNVLKHYAYNLSDAQTTLPKFLSAVQSKAFKRNNCPTNTNTYTYTVPAGRYVSTVSQEDANLKAMDEVNSKGQEYANNQGTCTP